MRVFAEGELSDYLRERSGLIAQEIKNEADDYILNVSETDYQHHLIEKFEIEPPSFEFEEVSMEEVERRVPAERFPRSYHVREGESYPRPAYIVHIPVSGATHLIRYTPSTRLMWSHDVTVARDELMFEVLVFSDDASQIRREIDGVIGNLRTQLGHLQSDIAVYNSQLPAQVGRAFDTRKEQILKQRSIVSQIGIPLRRAADAPRTFAVPSPAVPKKIVPKPQASSAPAKPEPTLASDDYQAILQIVADLGRSLERHPSTYEEKDEEALRDYLLLLLQPRFEGSATGETFNKSGKTDILLRHENHNIFIAECKFWSGMKGLLDAISQLLSYLTWRDSKVALVVFVRNKNFTQVLDKINQEISTHPEFARVVGSREEGWDEYRFTLPGDDSREVTLSILAFHLP